MKFHTIKTLADSPAYIKMQQQKQNVKILKSSPRIFVPTISDFFFLND